MVQISDPAYTFHIESPDVGGRVYARCVACGNESIAGPHQVRHDEGCVVAARQEEGFTPKPKSVCPAQVYSGVSATLVPKA